MCIDHSPLTTLLTTKELGEAGMYIVVTRLSLNFNYISMGLTFCSANCLSWLTFPAATSKQDENVKVVFSEIDAITTSEFKQACLACPIKAQYLKILQTKWPNSENKQSPILLSYYSITHELSLVDGYIFHGSHR